MYGVGVSDVNLSTKIRTFMNLCMQLYHDAETINVWIYRRYDNMVTYEVAHIFMKADI